MLYVLSASGGAFRGALTGGRRLRRPLECRCATEEQFNRWSNPLEALHNQISHLDVLFTFRYTVLVLRAFLKLRLVGAYTLCRYGQGDAFIALVLFTVVHFLLFLDLNMISRPKRRTASADTLGAS